MKFQIMTYQRLKTTKVADPYVALCPWVPGSNSGIKELGRTSEEARTKVVRKLQEILSDYTALTVTEVEIEPETSDTIGK